MGRMRVLRAAALVFALLAFVAGGLQLAAFFSAGFVRHLIVGVFACSVGVSVGVAAVASIVRSRRMSSELRDDRGQEFRRPLP